MSPTSRPRSRSRRPKTKPPAHFKIHNSARRYYPDAVILSAFQIAVASQPGVFLPGLKTDIFVEKRKYRSSGEEFQNRKGGLTVKIRLPVKRRKRHPATLFMNVVMFMAHELRHVYDDAIVRPGPWSYRHNRHRSRSQRWFEAWLKAPQERRANLTMHHAVLLAGSHRTLRRHVREACYLLWHKSPLTR